MPKNGNFDNAFKRGKILLSLGNNVLADPPGRRSDLGDNTSGVSNGEISGSGEPSGQHGLGDIFDARGTLLVGPCPDQLAPADEQDGRFVDLV